MEQIEDSHRSQRKDERLSGGRTSVMPHGAVMSALDLDLAVETVLVTLMLGLDYQERLQREYKEVNWRGEYGEAEQKTAPRS